MHGFDANNQIFGLNRSTRINLIPLKTGSEHLLVSEQSGHDKVSKHM